MTYLVRVYRGAAFGSVTLTHTNHHVYKFEDVWVPTGNGTWKHSSLSGDRWKSQIQRIPLILQADNVVICSKKLRKVALKRESVRASVACLPEFACCLHEL